MVGTNVFFTPMPGQRKDIDIAACELHDQSERISYSFHSEHVDAAAVAHPNRHVIAGVVEPEEGMTLTLVGARSGVVQATVQEVAKPKQVPGGYIFDDTVILRTSEPVGPGDSGSGCFYRVSPGVYRLACIMFSVDTENRDLSGRTIYALSAARAERELGVTFGRGPSAHAGDDITVVGGSTVRLDGSRSTGPDLDPLAYRWELLSDVEIELDDHTAVRPTFPAPVLDIEALDPDVPDPVLTFKLTVTDSLGGYQSDTVDVTVQPPSGQPTVWVDTGKTRGCGPTRQKEQARTLGEARLTRWVDTPEEETWGDWEDTGKTADLGATKEQSRTSSCDNTETRWVPVTETWGPWTDTGEVDGCGPGKMKEQERTSNLGNTETDWVPDPEPDPWGNWSDTGSTRGCGPDKEKEQARTSRCSRRQTKWVDAPEPDPWGSWTDTGNTADLGATKEQERTSKCGNRETRWVAVSPTPEPPEEWGPWTDTGRRGDFGASKEQSRTSSRGNTQTRWVVA